LRFVRSAVALDMPEFTDELEADRRRQYAEIAEVEALVKSAAPSQSAKA
jgi:hypothetical protein